MNIKLHEKMREFLHRTGNRDILIYQVSYHSCGGAVKEVSARFVEDKDRERISTAGYAAQPYEFGHVYYLPGTLKLKEQIKFRLYQAFGRSMLQLSGVAPVYSSPWGE